MAKYTVLQMVQQILSAMDSDQVNSINDTPEAMQIAYCIQHSYNNMLGRYDLPEHNQLFQLTSTSSSTPTLLLKPETGVQRLEWIDYYDTNPADSGPPASDQFGAYSHDLNTDIVQTNTWNTTSNSTNTIATGSNQTYSVLSSSTLPVVVGQAVQITSGPNFMIGSVISYSHPTLVVLPATAIGSGTYSTWFITANTGGGAPPGYLPIEILTQEDFFNMINSFNPADSTVGSYTYTVSDNYTGSPYSFTLYYKNDSQPKFCTIVGNQYIFFDSLDNTQDTFLNGTKTLAYGWVIPQFTISDGFTPVLDDQQFPMLVNEAKALAFLELKQTQHPKAEQEVARQLFSLQKFKHVANKPSQFSLLPSFGRRGNGYGGYPGYTQYRG